MEVSWVVAAETLAKALEIAKVQGEVVDSTELISDQWQSFIVRSRFGPYERTLSIGYVSTKQVNARCVENFAAASQRASAHLAVLSVPSGFGQDVMLAAAKGGVGLLPFESLAKGTVETWADLFKPALNCYDFGFSVSRQDGILGIPEEPALLAHFMRELRVTGPGIETVPHELLEKTQHQLAEAALGRAQRFEWPLPEGSVVIHPNSGVRTPVKAFSCTYRLVPVCQLTTKEGLGVDPYLLGRSLEDELAKRNAQADPSKIDEGFDTKLQPGRYYYNPKLQFSYYCESSNKRHSKLVLVESYQAGNLLQVRFEIPADSQDNLSKSQLEEKSTALVRYMSGTEFLTRTLKGGSLLLSGVWKVLSRSMN